MEYRYMIWNDLQKEFQFPSICTPTEKEANALLFREIGKSAFKWRFEVKKVEKEKALNIKKELKRKYKTKRIQSELPNIPYQELYKLVLLNERKNK